MSKNVQTNTKELEESQIRERFMGRNIAETVLIDPYTRENIKLTGRKNKVETRIMHCDLTSISPTRIPNKLDKCLVSDLMKNISLEDRPGIQRDDRRERTSRTTTGRCGVEADIQPDEIVAQKHLTRSLLEKNLAILEDSKFAITFPSGTSALNTGMEYWYSVIVS
jgi:hypothetical protein